MSRFSRHPKPPLYPHMDIHDRDSSENSGGYWDMGIDLENYDGSVYIKTNYIVDIAREIGMVDGAEVVALKEEIASLKRQIRAIDSVKEALERIKDVENELSAYLDNYSAGNGDSDSDGSTVDIRWEDFEVKGNPDDNSGQGS